MERELILIGGGGHCKSVIEACHSCGRRVRGVIDMPHKVGTRVLDVPIIATEDELGRFASECEFVVTVGSIKDTSVRERIFRHILEVGGHAATIVAATAHVSDYASLGAGTVVLHGACVNASAQIGDNVIINTLANIDHDVTIGDHTHVSTCASINGMAKVGHSSFVGSQAVVCQCVEICPKAVIGAGAVVNRDITLPGVYVGAPCRPL